MSPSVIRMTIEPRRLKMAHPSRSDIDRNLAHQSRSPYRSIGRSPPGAGVRPELFKAQS
jgi:hypothetical protein